MDIVRLLVLTSGGAAIGWALRVPSGFLVGAMVATAAGNLLLSHKPVTMPAPLFALGLALIGGQIGSHMTRETLGTVRSSLVPAVLSMFALIALGVLVAVGLRLLGKMDFLDAIFATSPGALSAVTGMSARVGANAALVASFHVLRIILVTLSLPLLLRIAR